MQCDWRGGEKRVQLEVEDEVLHIMLFMSSQELMGLKIGQMAHVDSWRNYNFHNCW